MLVTVVRSKTGEVVELPGDINIRPYNFVELKSLDKEMKVALGKLEAAGTVNVAQVLHTDIDDGKVENQLPADVTGAAFGSLPYTAEQVRKANERVKGAPDVLTDYSKTHVVTPDELSDRQKSVEERTERAAAAGDGTPVMRVVAITPEALQAEQDAVRRPAALPTSVEGADEKLSQEQIDAIEKSVDELDGAEKPAARSRKKPAEQVPA